MPYFFSEIIGGAKLESKTRKGDFIEIEYTGLVKDSSEVFDTTDMETAKKAGIHAEGAEYNPRTVCIGENHLLKGLEDNLAGKEVGKELEINLNPEQGFGKKNPKYIQLIPTGKFKKHNIQPAPGLQVNIDGIIGIVKTVTGGRTLVDFNHPLSGRALVYNVKINKIIIDDKEKLEGLARLYINKGKLDIEIDEGNATIRTDDEQQDVIKEKLKSEVKKLIPGVKKLSFAIVK